jgi:hypothetical protein
MAKPMTTPPPVPTRTRRRARRLRVLAGAAAFLVWAACGNLVLRQGWDPRHGPVVPHDSFPADCSLCHLGPGWHTLRPDFAFDHAASTGVELRGAHAQAPCLYCHNDRGPVARFAAQGCAGCHDDVHRGGLGRSCQDCHDERTWRPNGLIAQHDRTRFPLVGAHAAVACFRCHPGAQVGNFAGASSSCEHCHQDRIGRSGIVDHRALGLTADCQRCHRPIAWTPAQFTHPATFPLTGGHAGRRCAGCHVSGKFPGLSPDCASCHLGDWQRTTNPSHAAAGMPTTCQQCHGTAAWRPASFPGHRFPISGPHRQSCNECHRTPQNFAAFSCTHCHDHRRERMDDRHDAVPGYVWVSSACAQCHPDGRK